MYRIISKDCSNFVLLSFLDQIYLSILQSYLNLQNQLWLPHIRYFFHGEVKNEKDI
jgi:hypothetical protein